MYPLPRAAGGALSAQSHFLKLPKYKKMKNFMFWLPLACLMLTTSSCELVKGDDIRIDLEGLAELPPAARDYLDIHFPDHVLKHVEFEDLCNDSIYYEVELEDGPGPDINLYFTLEGNFHARAIEIALDSLPENIRQAIADGYAGYTIDLDDIERLEMADGSKGFLVKLRPVNGNGPTLELLFSAEGSLVCTDEDHDEDEEENEDHEDEDHHPADTSSAARQLILDYVAANFPGYRMEEIESEDLCDDTRYLKTELEDGPGPDIDLYFSLSGEFLFSATEIRETELPTAVRLRLENDYGNYQIADDDLYRLDFPDGSVQFLLELEPRSGSGSDIELILDADGTLICLDD